MEPLSRHIDEDSNSAVSHTGRLFTQTERRMRQLLTWHIKPGCCLHDSHNGYLRGRPNSHLGCQGQREVHVRLTTTLK